MGWRRGTLQISERSACYPGGGGGWSSGLPLPVEGAAHTAAGLGSCIVNVAADHLRSVSLVLVFGDLFPMGLMWSDGLLATTPRDGWGARPPFTSNGSSLLGGKMRFALPTIITVTTAALVLSGCGGTDSADGSSTETAKSEVSAKPEAQKLSEAGLKVLSADEKSRSYKPVEPITGGNIPVDEPGKYSASHVKFMQSMIDEESIRELPDVTFPGVKPWADHKTAMESCLTDKGFSGLGWGLNWILPDGEQARKDSWGPSLLECWASNPPESRYVHSMNMAQKRANHEYRSTTQYACAKAEGLNPKEPPTFEENEAAQGLNRWSSYSNASSDLKKERIDEIDKKCPWYVDLPTLYSDELLASAE